MRVGTIRQSTVTDFAIGGAICPKCKQPFTAQMNRTIQTATMLAVPFMKKTGERYTICPHCGCGIPLRRTCILPCGSGPPQIFCTKSAAGCFSRGRKSGEARRALPQKRGTRRGACASARRLRRADWYLGHYKRALIACILDALGLVCFFAALAVENAQPLLFLAAGLFAFSLYWGLVDTVRILLGRAKDAEGLYVCTRRQHARWMEKKEKLS